MAFSGDDLVSARILPRHRIAGGAIAKGISLSDPKSHPSRRPVANSMKWALIVPVLLTFGGWVAQYPYGLIAVGVIIMVATWGMTVFLVGSVWERPGAAIMVSLFGIALPLFAGPGLYIVYMTTLGESAPAVVTEVEERNDEDGADWFCTVVETTGERSVHHISQQENCFGQIKQSQRVTVRKDPLNLLDPRLPDRPGEDDTGLAVLSSAGLFSATGATILYGGLRRRSPHSHRHRKGDPTPRMRKPVP